MNEERRVTDQTKAIEQFRVWATSPGLLVVDTETTALDGEVWEFAAVPVEEDAAPLLAFICRPGTDEWSIPAATMHRARLRYVEAAPPASMFKWPVHALLEGNRRVLSYGAEFDMARVQQTWQDLTLRSWGCIMTAYAPLAGRWSQSKGAWKYVKLQEACELERVSVSHLAPAHTALGDAQRAAALVRAVAERETPGELEHREWIDYQERVELEGPPFPEME